MLAHLSKKLCDDECHICLEKKTKKDFLVLSCMHTFHASCLFDWFDKNTVCPLCMKKQTVIFSTISRNNYKKNKNKQKIKKQCCNIL